MPGVLDEFRDEQVERMKRKRFGLYRGIVRDVDDPENMGRVRVEIHELLGPGKLTDWASYCSPRHCGSTIWLDRASGTMRG